MAIAVKFYTFSKKINSTAQPTAGTELSTLNVTLKAPCSIVNPVLTLQPESDPTPWNYAYISKFNRYYRILDWTYSGTTWTAALVCDVLASWKTQIGNSTMYIARSASSYDGKIIDTMYPAIEKFQQINTLIGSGEQWNNGPCIVLGIAGPGENIMSSVQYYAVNPSVAHQLFEFLWGRTEKSIGGVSQTIIEALTDETQTEKYLMAHFDPMKFIASAMWFPIPASSLGDPVTTIKLGYWDIPLGNDSHGDQTHAYKLPSYLSWGGFDTYTDIPVHPQNARGSYLSAEPYAKYTLEYQGFGTIPLDSDAMVAGTKLNTSVFVDLATGKGSLMWRTTDSTHALKYGPYFIDGQIGVPIQLSGSAISSGSVFGNFLGGATNMALNTVADIFSGLSIGNVVKNATREVRTNGTNGSTLTYSIGLNMLHSRFTYVTDNSLSDHGAPLCKDKKINTLSGFIQVIDSHIEIPATDPEINEVNSLLEGGFFYE